MNVLGSELVLNICVSKKKIIIETNMVSEVLFDGNK